MTREELTNLTVKRLDEICKELGLPRYKGKTHLNKTEMIELICNETRSKVENEEVLAKESSNEVKIKKAEIGNIVAFKDKRGNVRSGKIIEFDSNKNIYQISLKSGRCFYVSPEDIIWVTTPNNKRWPREVLNLLKESQKKIEQDFENFKLSKTVCDNLKNKMMGG